MTVSSPPTFRLFVALDLPDAVRGQMLGWAARTLTDIPGVRLQRPEAMHVTLCFLGGQPANEVEAIAHAVRGAVGARSQLTLTPGGPIWLPRRRPRVAAVELIDDTGELAALQSSLAGTLAQGGWYEPERRLIAKPPLELPTSATPRRPCTCHVGRFLAHVTVARIGRNGLRQPSELPAPPAVPVVAPSVSLYRSHTGPSGARYEPLATVGLLRRGLG